MQLSTHYTAGAVLLPEVSATELVQADNWFREHFNLVNTTSRLDGPVEVELEWHNFLAALALYRKSPEPCTSPVPHCNVLNCSNPTKHNSVQHFSQGRQ